MNPKNRFSETSSLSQKEADREGKPASIWSQCNLASSCRLLRLPKLFQDAQMRFSSKSPPVNRVNRATASVPPALARSAARAPQESHSAPFCRSRSDKCNFLKPLIAPPNQPGSGQIVSEASGSRILDWFHFSSGVSFLFSTIFSSVEKLFSIPRFFKRQPTFNRQVTPFQHASLRCRSGGFDYESEHSTPQKQPPSPLQLWQPIPLAQRKLPSIRYHSATRRKRQPRYLSRWQPPLREVVADGTADG